MKTKPANYYIKSIKLLKAKKHIDMKEEKKFEIRNSSGFLMAFAAACGKAVKLAKIYSEKSPDVTITDYNGEIIASYSFGKKKVKKYFNYDIWGNNINNL